MVRFTLLSAGIVLFWLSVINLVYLLHNFYLFLEIKVSIITQLKQILTDFLQHE